METPHRRIATRCVGVHEGGAPSGGPWGTYTLSMYVPPLFSHTHPPLIVCVFSFFRVFVIHPHARDVDVVRDVDRSRGRSTSRSVDTGVWFLFRARVVHAYIAHSARVWGGGADARGCPDVRSTDRPIWVGRSVVRPSVRPSARVRRGCATSAVVVAARVHRRRRSPSSKVASTVVEVTRQTFVVDESASSTPFVVVVVVVVDTTRARARDCAS